MRTARTPRVKRWLTNALVMAIIGVLALIAARLVMLSRGPVTGSPGLTEHERTMTLFTAANQRDVQVTIPGRPHHLPALMAEGAAIEPLVTYTFSTNAHGLRGPSFDVARTPGTYRILCAGECVVFGNGVQDEDLWTARLQALLDVREPGRFEVINAGTVGTPPHLLADRLATTWMTFSPDLVVFSPGTASAMNPAHNGVAPFRLWLRPEEYEMASSEYRLALQAALDAAGGGGAPLVLITPTLSSFFLPDGTQWVDWMHAWADAEGLPCLDTTALLRAEEARDGLLLEADAGQQRLVRTRRGKRKVLLEVAADHAPSEGFVSPTILQHMARRPRVEQRLFIDDNHPTPEGHQRIAEQLLALLEEHQLLP